MHCKYCILMQPAWTGEGVQPELGPGQQNFDFLRMLTELVIDIDSTILGKILKLGTQEKNPTIINGQRQTYGLLSVFHFVCSF